MNQQKNKYLEWLTTIANTRLIYNRIDELEAFLEAPSIHSNGIKRCFTTLQQQRSAFRDLKEEVKHMTGNDLDLEEVMDAYRQAWDFYRDNLSRRTNPEEVAAQLVQYYFNPRKRKGLGKRMTAIFEQVEAKDIDVTMLLLMLLKAWRGYDSKDGDVTDMKLRYETVISFIERNTIVDAEELVEPRIKIARESPDKSRIVLYYCVKSILDFYSLAFDDDGLYELNEASRDMRVHLNLDGYWNECGGTLNNTSFWKIEAIEYGVYEAMYWVKNADNVLIGIKYIISLMRDGESLLVYLLAPQAIEYKINKRELNDEVRVWYNTPMPDDDMPNEMKWVRKMSSEHWPHCTTTTRVVDEQVIAVYDNLLKTCSIEKPYKHLDYVFHANIYAITCDAIYIPTTDNNKYYRVPKFAMEGLDRITLDSNVGVMEMNNKRYIAIDDYFTYIPESKMKNYGIKIVDHIE